MYQIFQMTQIFSNQLIFFESQYAICQSWADTKHSIDKEKQLSPGSAMLRDNCVNANKKRC